MTEFHARQCLKELISLLPIIKHSILKLVQAHPLMESLMLVKMAFVLDYLK